MSLKQDISTLTYTDTQLSRRLRAVHRHLSHEQSIAKKDKQAQLSAAKKGYNELKKIRPSVGDTEKYEAWKNDYADAQEQWQQAQQDINDYYDDLMQDLEQEAQDEEEELQEEQTRVETQRDAMQAELEAIQDQIKTEIQQEAIKF